MKTIVIYRNPDCAKCARIGRIHKFFDWLGRVEVSTETPRIGPMQPGEIAVEDLRTGEILQGVPAVRRIFRQIPAYLPFLPLLSMPAIARRVDRDVRGCTDGSCALPTPR